MNARELLKKALSELKDIGYNEPYILIKEIESELAKPEQEPSAHMFPSDIKRFSESETFAQAYSVPCGNPNETTVPLYTSPPQYKPLSDDEIREVIFNSFGLHGDKAYELKILIGNDLPGFARAIEKRITEGKE